MFATKLHGIAQESLEVLCENCKQQEHIQELAATTGMRSPVSIVQVPAAHAHMAATTPKLVGSLQPQSQDSMNKKQRHKHTRKGRQ